MIDDQYCNIEDCPTKEDMDIGEEVDDDEEEEEDLDEEYLHFEEEKENSNKEYNEDDGEVHSTICFLSIFFYFFSN